MNEVFDLMTLEFTSFLDNQASCPNSKHKNKQI